MASLITMPKLSDTMEEGGVFAWLIAEGDRVEEGDPLVEIETDKATMEYPAPEEGYVLKFLAQKGDQVALGAPMAVIAASADENFVLQDLLAESSPRSAAAPAVQQAPPTSEPAQQPSTDKRVKISPLAKKLAASSGLDVQQLRGSGPGGRIVKRDIEEALKSAQKVPSAVSLATEPEQPQRHKLSLLRKSIAQNLVRSKQESPHFYLTTSARVGALLALRAELTDHYAKENILDEERGVAWKVSLNDLFVFAVAHALRKHPALRSSWQGDYILENAACHVAVAVALEEGLVTPVLHHADRRDLLDLSRSLRSLIRQAQSPRRGTLDLSSGVFTVSNLGMSCVEEFAAVINPPQSAILAIGRIQHLPRFDEQGELMRAAEVKLTLSCDHRVVDGMVGARFLDTLVSVLENPLLLL